MSGVHEVEHVGAAGSPGGSSPGLTSRGRLLIDGQWLDGAGGTDLQVVDPATGRPVGWTAAADDDQVAAALLAARRGQELWSGTAPADRGAVLLDASELLSASVERHARLLTEEQGKPLAEARAELSSVVALLRWFGTQSSSGADRTQPGGTAGLEVSVEQRPLGPVALLTPWNFPVSLAARKLSAALAVGCAAIVKPAPEAPSAFLGVAEALQDAGLPNGVLGVLNGDPARISAALIGSPVIRAVSFTGSTEVGRLVGRLAGEHVKPATLELGGHAPVIVCEDVDVDDVADQLVRSAYLNAGQVCVSPTRLLVHRQVSDDFLGALLRRVEMLRVGPGTQSDVDMGPLALERTRTRLLDIVERSVSAGAGLELGGESLPREGWFLAPTVLVDAPTEAAVMNEEPFGPVVVVNRFGDDDEAVAEANRLPVGLAAYVFAKDRSRAAAIARRVEAGTVGVNTCSILHVDSSLGGVQDSGYGRDGGEQGMDAFRSVRTVTTHLP